MKIRFTITAEVPDGAYEPDIHRLAGNAFVQVEDPADDISFATRNAAITVDVGESQQSVADLLETVYAGMAERISTTDRAALANAVKVLRGDALPEPKTPAPVLNFLIGTDADGELFLECPHCHSVDNIIEVDRAERWNDGEPTFEDGVLTYINWGRGDGDFHHERYQCGGCDTELLLPEGADPEESWD